MKKGIKYGRKPKPLQKTFSENAADYIKLWEKHKPVIRKDGTSSPEDLKDHASR